MKNTKVSDIQRDVNVINTYNVPQHIFEGIPKQYRSFVDFDIALIKERYSDSKGDVTNVILHRAYFEV